LFWNLTFKILSCCIFRDEIPDFVRRDARIPSQTVLFVNHY